MCAGTVRGMLWGFVFKKTLPFFWVPCHTITFVLPTELRVLFAAALGVVLGSILAIASPKTSARPCGAHPGPDASPLRSKPCSIFPCCGRCTSDQGGDASGGQRVSPFGILERFNFEAAAPFPDSRSRRSRYLKRAPGMQTPEEFEQILLKVNQNGSQVRLRDVAKVELAAKSFAITARYNGKPSSGLALKLSPGANQLATEAAIKAELAHLQKTFPPGLKIVYSLDTEPYIRLSIEEVVKTLLEAIVLVFAVMLLFLQNFRATLIPTIAVPVVLLGTFAVMTRPLSHPGRRSSKPPSKASTTNPACRARGVQARRIRRARLRRSGSSRPRQCTATLTDFRSRASGGAVRTARSKACPRACAMQNSIVAVIREMVRTSDKPAKALAKELGKPYSTFMRYNEYHTLLAAGLDPDDLTVFALADGGLGLPEDGLYCLDDTWRRDPDLCRAVARASVEGWLYAFAHPDEALDIVMVAASVCHGLGSPASREMRRT